MVSTLEKDCRELLKQIERKGYDMAVQETQPRILADGKYYGYISETIISRAIEKHEQQGNIMQQPESQSTPPIIIPFIGPPVPSVIVEDNFLILKDIACVDADGNEFESYDRIAVAMDRSRSIDNAYYSFSLLKAIAYYQDRDMFLPSFALTMNILHAIYRARGNKYADNVYRQFIVRPVNSQLTNTIINYTDNADAKIIHYPRIADFSLVSNSISLNKGLQRKEAAFARRKKGSRTTLEDALKNPQEVRFLRHVTGLADISVLTDKDFLPGGLFLEYPIHTRNSAFLWSATNQKLIMDFSHQVSEPYCHRGVKRVGP